MSTDDKPKVYITYSSHQHGGHRADASDPYSDRTPRYIVLEDINVYREPPKYGCGESVVVDPKVLNAEQVFVVVVRYRDGDTFGYGTGYFQFYGVCTTREEVEAMKQEIENPKNDAYLPWTGYFARLERIEVHYLPLM